MDINQIGINAGVGLPSTYPAKIQNFNKSSQPSFQTYLQKTQAAPLSAKEKSAPVATKNITPPSHLEQSEEAAAPTEVKASVASYVDPTTYEVPTEDQDFSFEDFIDIINPLHHIPIVGTIYRGLSGDEIKPAVRIAGDILYGAVAGSVLFSAITSVTSLAIEQQTGEEPVTLIADALFGSKNDPLNEPEYEELVQNTSKQAEKPIQLAENTPPTPQTQQVTSPQNASGPPIQLATQPQAKMAYGGVIAPTTGASSLAITQANAKPMDKPSMINPAAIATAMGLPQKGMMRIGDKIIPQTTVRAAAAASPLAPMAANQETTAPQTRAQMEAKAKMTVATLNPKLPGTTSTAEGKNIGQIMQESSDIKTKGGTLPPALVHDMMMMALDKYKTASGLSPSELNTGTLN